MPYASLESVIEENKDLYYAALRKTQVTLREKEADWEPWVSLFLLCLKKQKDNLSKKLDIGRYAATVVVASDNQYYGIAVLLTCA